MPPIEGPKDVILFITVALTVITFLAAVLTLQVWVAVHIVSLVMGTQFIEALGWSMVFMTVISAMGLLKQVLGVK